MGQINRKNRSRILQNPNVVRVTEKHIVFTEQFQATAVQMRRAGYTFSEIVEQSGFRASDFEPSYFHGCVERWRNQERAQMSGKPKRGKRGRPKGFKAKNFETLENLSAEDLKSIIIVQEEMINELKKRKALAKDK